MSKINAIVIDDEQPARDLIKLFLKDYPNIECVAEAGNGFEGAKVVNEHRPDLIFLDIQMPKIDGFEMLELLDYSPQVIFCTAYDEFAIKAFEQSAVDYLLKPFSKGRFAKAIDKIIKIPDTTIKDLPMPSDYHKPLNRIVIKDRKEIVILDVEKVNYLEAQDDYVEIHSSEGKWLKQQTMKYFEEALDQDSFARVHRKFIIRLEALSKIDKMGKETYVALLKDGASIPVSQGGYQKLKQLLGL